jgi:hypothetical protein
MVFAIGLPAIILLLSFFLKLAVDRTPDLPEFVVSLCEFPVDIAFLATSLVAAFTIGHPNYIEKGLLSFGLYILAAAVVVLCWRRSVRYFESERPFCMFFAAAASYLISGYILGHAIALLTPAGG